MTDAPQTAGSDKDKEPKKLFAAIKPGATVDAVFWQGKRYRKGERFPVAEEIKKTRLGAFLDYFSA